MERYAKIAKHSDFWQGSEDPSDFLMFPEMLWTPLKRVKRVIFQSVTKEAQKHLNLISQNEKVLHQNIFIYTV